MFDQKKAEAYLQSELKWYGIKVIKWSATSCGYAYFKTKQIKIPKPTSIDRFGVCMHEIKHCLPGDGQSGKRYEQEFACDMYALDKIRELGFDEGVEAWIKRTKWHVLSRIAMAVNRGMQPENINPKVAAFFPEIDFKTWRGKKVFVRGGGKYDCHIKLTDSLHKRTIEERLLAKGLLIHKSESDDSTYGHWIVGTTGFSGYEFSNLSEVVEHYKLNQY